MSFSDRNAGSHPNLSLRKFWVILPPPIAEASEREPAKKDRTTKIWVFRVQGSFMECKLKEFRVERNPELEFKWHMKNDVY